MLFQVRGKRHLFDKNRSAVSLCWIQYQSIQLTRDQKTASQLITAPEIYWKDYLDFSVFGRSSNASPFHKVTSAFQTIVRMLVERKKGLSCIYSVIHWMHLQDHVIDKLAERSAALSPPHTCTSLPRVWSVGLPCSHLSINATQSIETPSEHPRVRGELRLRVGQLC